MKKMRIFLPIAIAVLGVVFFSQCKKDNSCTLRVSCYYPANNNDTLVPVSNAFITFETNLYDTFNHKIDSLISLVHFYYDSITDKNDTILIPINIEDIPNDSLSTILSEGKYKYITNEKGVFTYTLPYPALLVVKATKIDSTTNASGIVVPVRYTATSQVKLDEGETTDIKLIVKPK